MPNKPLVAFRSFKRRDQQACLRIFQGHLGSAFAEPEMREFQEFFSHARVPYYVVEIAGGVVACGGLKLEPIIGIAKLRWDMVQVKRQRQGIGRFLTLARLSLLYDQPEIERVQLGTSQAAYGFYQRMGFQVTQFTPNGILPEWDEYRMEMTLTPERKEEIKKAVEEMQNTWIQTESSNQDV